MLVRVAFILCWICATSANPLENGRILYGDKIQIEEAPFQVSVQRSSTGSHTCGGSIVSRDYVLTAAHCASQPPSSYQIRSGSSYWPYNGTLHKVVEVLSHEEYNGNDFGSPVNDVALMKVDPPFEFGKTRNTVELFEQGEDAVPGSKATVIGWGKTENGTLSNYLQSLDINIISKSDCNDAYSQLGGLPKSEICAAHVTGLKDMCSGDSGGPLLVNGKQAGIVSWSGPGCGLPEYPGVYTEVASYRNWIDKHILASV